MINPMIRQARLKPEYAELYPGMQPGVWLPAADAAAQVLAVMRGATRAFEDRISDRVSPTAAAGDYLSRSPIPGKTPVAHF